MLYKSENYKIKKYLIDLYPTFDSIRVSKIKHNNLNSNNFLIYDKNQYFVLHENINQKYQNIEKICKILKHCHNKNAKVPLPIENKFSNYVDKTNGRYLTKYSSGTFFSGSKNELRNLSFELASLHKILKKTNIKLPQRSSNSMYSPIDHKFLQSIIIKIKKKSNKMLIDKIILKNYDLLLNSLNTLYRKKPKKDFQLIHGDLHVGNVIFAKNKVNSFIDFNSMRFGNILEDIAFCGFRFNLKISSNKSTVSKNLEFFIKEYTKQNSKIRLNQQILANFFQREIIIRTSFIIKSNYIHKSYIWNKDLNKFLHFLKFIKDFKEYYN